MCNASLALGTQAFGAGASAFGSYFSAQAQRSALRSEARMAETGATVMDEMARRSISAGTVQESRVKLAGEQAKSRSIAQMAGRGIDIANSPTAIARLTGTDLVTDVDAQTVRTNALREAMGYRADATSMRNAARSARASASSISPLMAAGASLVSSAGQVAQTWYKLDREGAFGGGPTQAGGGVGTIQPTRTSADDFRWGDIFGSPSRGVLTAGVGF